MNLCKDNAEEWQRLCRVEAAKVQAEALRPTPPNRGPSNPIVDQIRTAAVADRLKDGEMLKEMERLSFRLMHLERELAAVKRGNGK